jgi:Ca-activated chloride channel family protein
LVLAASAAVVAFARPVIAAESEESVSTVILAIDTSLSMMATDVSPTRVDAAREAASVFLDSVPEGVAVGVIGFDGAARLLIQPTTRLDAVRGIVEGSIVNSKLGEGTAIGEAGDGGEPVGTIVVLSDGETTMGRPNDEAGNAARGAGIPVHTIAFGTDSGVIDDPLAGPTPVPVNEAALEALARQTGGQALDAASVEELSEVYAELGRSVRVQTEQVEIGDWFAGATILILGLAGLGSLLWFGRLP